MTVQVRGTGNKDALGGADAARPQRAVFQGTAADRDVDTAGDNIDVAVAKSQIDVDRSSRLTTRTARSPAIARIRAYGRSRSAPKKVPPRTSTVVSIMTVRAT